jgi:hypothetical protein
MLDWFVSAYLMYLVYHFLYKEGILSGCAEHFHLPTIVTTRTICPGRSFGLIRLF